MAILARIFDSLDRSYMVRAYLIGLFCFVIIYFLYIPRVTEQADAGNNALFLIVLFACNTLLFPFAKGLWDETRDFLMGRTILFLPVIILFPLKLIVNCALWSFSLILGPFGMAYFWYRTR